MVSGVAVGLGAILVGVAFVILGAAQVVSGSLSRYYAWFYALLGFGIALIGLSWTFARMAPRTK